MVEACSEDTVSCRTLFCPPSVRLLSSVAESSGAKGAVSPPFPGAFLGLTVLADHQDPFYYGHRETALNRCLK